MPLTREIQPEDTGFDGMQAFIRAHIETPCVSSLEYLCEDCKAVDWDYLSGLGAKYPNNELGQRIQHASVSKSHAELRNSSCQACRLLSAIKPISFDTKKCVLVATSMSWSIGVSTRNSRDSGLQCTVIGFSSRSKIRERFFDIHKTGCLAVLGANLDSLSIKPSTIKPDSIDYESFQRLMTLCDDTHKGPCKVHSDTGDVGLQVIEIWTRKIVRAPEKCRYVALSYVWGQAGDVASDNELSSAPLVVQDAISVTASMGCQYLWVDRYCIPQNSPDKHRMINQMDKIYSGAFFTIIAAAGNDAHSGLPGVSQVHRQPPKQLRLSEAVVLQQVYPHPVHLLDATQWTSRAWTYQEGFLSRRRLIFTKEQVIFLCNSMYFAESVMFPLEMDFVQSQKSSMFKHLIGNVQKRLYDRMAGVRDQIHEYSGRTLRYDTDSLNAFSGVLSYHTSTALESYPISHVWGVPFAVYNEVSPWNPQAPSCSDFYLFWMHKTTARRRHGFPSWSWTGWAGIVSLPVWSVTFSLERSNKLEQSSREKSSQIDANIYVQGTSEEDSDPRKMTLAELFRNLILSRQSDHQIDQNTYRRLLVSCLVRPLRFVHVELPGVQANSSTLVQFPYKANSQAAHGYELISWEVPRSSGGYAIFRFQKNIHVGAKVYWDEMCDVNAVSCLLLYHRQYLSNKEVECAFLLVKRVDDGQYQRVGMVFVHVRLPSGGEETIFMDEDGEVLDEVIISGFAETPLLRDGERRNICLI